LTSQKLRHVKFVCRSKGEEEKDEAKKDG